MGKITVKEEFEVKSSDGKLSIKLQKENGKFDYMYITGGGTGTIVNNKPDEVIELLEQLKEKVLE